MYGGSHIVGCSFKKAAEQLQDIRKKLMYQKTGNSFQNDSSRKNNSIRVLLEKAAL